MASATNIMEHLLRLAGLSKSLARGQLKVVGRNVPSTVVTASAECGAIVIVAQPDRRLLGDLGISLAGLRSGPWCGGYLGRKSAAFSVMRGFGDIEIYQSHELEPVVTTGLDEPVWSWRTIGSGGILLLGNDVAADIVRFRQGEPTRKPSREDHEKWGYAGERPNYLFDPDIDRARPHDRPGDWPLFAIADFVRTKSGLTSSSLLPEAAGCALVITGDSDGATPENYAQQRLLLGDLPITYFLRTACAPSSETLHELDADSRVDLQLHPDALDAPESYGKLLSEQAAWFDNIIGRRPVLLRNHGYLNDGYWRHAVHWLNNGMTWSANLPGVDGLVLNGSLLPAKLVLDGALISHWSLATPYGDGMIFAMGLSGEEAANRIERHIDDILQSEVPGVLALNLHPANVAHTGALHAALQRLADRGVIAWSMAQCANWFEQLDADR